MITQVVAEETDGRRHVVAVRWPEDWRPMRWRHDGMVYDASGVLPAAKYPEWGGLWLYRAHGKRPDAVLPRRVVLTSADGQWVKSLMVEAELPATVMVGNERYHRAGVYHGAAYYGAPCYRHERWFGE